MLQCELRPPELRWRTQIGRTCWQSGSDTTPTFGHETGVRAYRSAPLPCAFAYRSPPGSLEYDDQSYVYLAPSNAGAQASSGAKLLDLVRNVKRTERGGLALRSPGCLGRRGLAAPTASGGRGPRRRLAPHPARPGGAQAPAPSTPPTSEGASARRSRERLVCAHAPRAPHSRHRPRPPG